MMEINMRSYFVSPKTRTVANSTSSAQADPFMVKGSILEPISEQNLHERILFEVLQLCGEVSSLKTEIAAAHCLIQQAVQALSTVGDIEPVFQKIEAV